MLSNCLLSNGSASFPMKLSWVFTRMSTRSPVAWKSVASRRAWSSANAFHRFTDTQVCFNNIAFVLWNVKFNRKSTLDSQPYCRLEQFGCLAKYAQNITEVRDCNFCELSCSNTVYDIEKLSKTLVKSKLVLLRILGIQWSFRLQVEQRYKCCYLYQHWIPHLADHSIQTGSSFRLGWSAGILWWYSRTFLGLQFIVGSGNYLLLYNASDLHVVSE